jgi:SAM-dependent methyltransferase
LEVTIHVNYCFALDFAASRFPGGVCLDYGCGAGDTVAAGLAKGMNIFGVEIFQLGPPSQEKAITAGLLGKEVRELAANGRIPFPDSFFDVVLSNMVFEHVSDLGAVLAEIHRVLKPTGELLAVFPSVEVIREGHCGVPLVHRLANHPRVAYFYLRIARALGLGYHHDRKVQTQWASDFVKYLQQFCFYRSEREIFQHFSAAGFVVRGVESDYVDYRLRQGRLAPLARLARVGGPLTFALRKLATMVLVATPAARMLIGEPRRVSAASAALRS